MIRCIQIGTVTVQGELRPSHYGPTPATACVRYEGGKPVMAEFGRIVATFGLVYGRLTESKRAVQARYGAEELAEIKRWMAGE